MLDCRWCWSIENASRAMLKMKAPLHSPATLRLHLPQGACLAWRRGASGEEHWHGESRKGSFPDYDFTVRAAVLLVFAFV